MAPSSQALLLVGIVVGLLSVTADAVTDDYISTIGSACMQSYINLQINAPYQRVFLPLPEVMECFRMTPMSASSAFNIVKYAQLNYELHSVRSNMPGVSGRFTALLGELFNQTSITTPGATPSFSSAAVGISEFDFHLLVTNVFNSAQDYHFTYEQQNFFGSTFLSRILVTGSRWNANTNSQELYVRGLSPIASTWVGWFNTQSQVIPNPTDSAYDLNAAITKISNAASNKLKIVSINGLDPVQQYYAQLWRVASNMHDDHSAFNDLLSDNLVRTLLHIPPQYFFQKTSRKFSTSAPSPSFFSQMYTRNTTLPTLSNAYYEDYLLSDGTTIRVPLLLDVNYNSKPSSNCVVSARGGVGNRGLSDADAFFQKVNGASGGELPSIVAATTTQVRPWGDVFEGKPLRSKIAMRKEHFPRFDNDHRRRSHDSDDDGGEKPGLREQRRRRLDPYAGLPADETSGMRTYRVYQSSMINAYYIPAVPATVSVMYLRIYSFVDSSLSQGLQDMANAVNAILARAEPDRATNLVLDVRGNGGGYVILSQVLLAILDYTTFQDNYTSTPNYDRPVVNAFRNSSMMLYSLNLSAKIGFNTTVNPNPFLSTATYASVLGQNFYTYQLNGTSNGTEFPQAIIYPSDPISATWFYDAQGPSGYDYNVPNFSTPLFMQPPLSGFPTSGGWQGWTNITLVTDGTCGSACCMFETRLTEFLPRSRFTFKSVGFGGLATGSTTGAVMQSSQFCGGSVLSMYCTPDAYQSQNISSTKYLFPGRYELYTTGSALWYPVDMRFNEWHWLSNPSTGTPRQFTDHPVQIQIKAWDVNMADVVNFVYGGQVTVASSSASLQATLTGVVIVVVLQVIIGFVM